MLHAANVSFRYHSAQPWVLSDVDLQVAPGEVVGLCGPSGGGKSTLGRVLAGMLRPDRGRVTVDGRSARHRRGPFPVQMVLQDAQQAMDPRWTVRRILATGATGAGLVGTQLVDPTWLDRRPHELSGGELQRVNLARALLARPRYLVVDEITASLDAITQARIWQLLLHRCGRAGVGVLAIAHDRALLEQVGHRVVDWTRGVADR